jgi:hypothetical protein
MCQLGRTGGVIVFEIVQSEGRLRMRRDLHGSI